MPKVKSTTPTPVKTEGRNCFGIMWFTSPEEAEVAAAHVRAQGRTYNGGFYHGMPCGRDSGFDYTDAEHGPLYAVTN